MPAFKKFGPGDQIDNVLVLEPRYDLASGSGGWRGSPEVSSSLSLYGGSRRSATGVVRSATYQPLYPGIQQADPPTKGMPMTASVNVVWLTNEPLDLSRRGDTRWGDEHWRPTMRLYQDYYGQSSEYVTSSYDFYCLYFHPTSRNVLVNIDLDDSANSTAPTGSFTLESWVKPFTTSSLTRSFTIESMNQCFWLGITGSSGRLVLSSSVGVATSSIGVPADRWSHTAVTFDAVSNTGTFYIGLQSAGQFTLGGALPSPTKRVVTSIGNVIDSNAVDETGLSTGSLTQAFHGFIGETRSWPSVKSLSQLSSSHDRRLTDDELTTATSCLTLVEGPLSRVFATAMGSGTVDYARYAHANIYHIANMNGFSDRSGPVWHPSDNIHFYPPKQLVPSFIPEGTGDFAYPLSRGDDVSRMLILEVPSAFYGREIAPNSVKIVDRSWSGPNYKMVRTIVDDGRGGLYISGSVSSGSSESYTGVGWNKIGNVFYGEGLVVIKEPSLLDMGRIDGSSAHPTNTLEFSFKGTSMVPVKTLMCRVDRGTVNCSLNPTFYDEEEDGQLIRRHPSGNLYVSTVGVYNSDRELVGIAKFADPVRVRTRDRLNLRLRMDF